MKKISEMSLEELQDYALDLESKQSAAATKENELNTKITELTNLNQTLQTRNNNLLMKVEAQHSTEPAPAEPAPVESCEDFARRIATPKKEN